MQVDESVRTYGRTVPLRSTVVYGGIPMDPADQGAARRRRDPRRHARPAARPRRPEGRQPRPGRDPRPRRGRPDARHGLPAGHPADHRAAPGAAPEPDVLGHVLRRHPAPVRHDPARPGDGRGRAAEHGRRGRRAARLPGRPRPQGGAARPPHPRRTTCARSSCSPGPSSPPAGWPPGSTARASMRWPSTRDRSQPERTTALEGFKTGDIRVLVATDVAARGLDIEDLPVVVNFELPWNPQDYIHRIGRTGRAGRRPARRSRSCASTRSTCCAASSGCSSGPSRGRSRTGSSPTGTPRRARSGCARVTPGPRREHHAHRKPVRRRRVGVGAAAAEAQARRPQACRVGTRRPSTAPGKKKPEHEVGDRPLDDVAIDERVRQSIGRAALGRPAAPGATSREHARTRPLGRVRARPGSKPGQGRQLAVDGVRARPRADRCQAAWTGMTGRRRRRRAGCRRSAIVDSPVGADGRSVDRLPGRSVELERRRRLEDVAQVPGTVDGPAGDPFVV